MMPLSPRCFCSRSRKLARRVASSAAWRETGSAGRTSARTRAACDETAARRYRARVGASAVAVTAMVGGRPSACADLAAAADIRAGNRDPIARRNGLRRSRRDRCGSGSASPASRRGSQPLRRDIEQPQRAGPPAPSRMRGALRRVGGGIERGGGDAELAQLRDLIAHQRDERRDDERQRRRATAPAAGTAATCRCRSA